MSEQTPLAGNVCTLTTITVDGEDGLHFWVRGDTVGEAWAALMTEWKRRNLPALTPENWKMLKPTPAETPAQLDAARFMDNQKPSPAPEKPNPQPCERHPSSDAPYICGVCGWKIGAVINVRFDKVRLPESYVIDTTPPSAPETLDGLIDVNALICDIFDANQNVTPASRDAAVKAALLRKLAPAFAALRDELAALKAERMGAKQSNITREIAEYVRTIQELRQQVETLTAERDAARAASVRVQNAAKTLVAAQDRTRSHMTKLAVDAAVEPLKASTESERDMNARLTLELEQADAARQAIEQAARKLLDRAGDPFIAARVEMLMSVELNALRSLLPPPAETK